MIHRIKYVEKGLSSKVRGYLVKYGEVVVTGIPEDKIRRVREWCSSKQISTTSMLMKTSGHRLSLNSMKFVVVFDENKSG
jgi:hypothetical protein